MSAVLEAKTQMRVLAKKAEDTVADTKMTGAEKRSVLDDIQVDLKNYSSLISVHEEAERMANGGETSDDTKAKAAASFKSVGNQVIDSAGYKDIAQMFTDNARRQFSKSIDIKAPAAVMGEGTTLDAGGFPTGAGGAAVIPQFLPGVVGIRTRRLMIADLFTPGTTGAAAVSYLKQTQWNNNAAGTAEGAKKPLSDQKFVRVLEQVGKITNLEKVTDELMQDAPGLLSFIEGQLMLGVLLAEDQDLLTATGYPSVSGLLTRSGMQTLLAANGTNAGGGAVNVIDKVFNMITTIRTNAFVEPDTALFHPTDWQNIRLAKDGNGQYYGGGPFNTGPYGPGSGYTNVDALWGLTVVSSPAVPLGKPVIGGFRECAQLFTRQGITIEMTNSNVDDFENNLVTMRSEKREALAVYRPGGFGQLNISWT